MELNDPPPSLALHWLLPSPPLPERRRLPLPGWLDLLIVRTRRDGAVTLAELGSAGLRSDVLESIRRERSWRGHFKPRSAPLDPFKPQPAASIFYEVFENLDRIGRRNPPDRFRLIWEPEE